MEKLNVLSMNNEGNCEFIRSGQCASCSLGPAAEYSDKIFLDGSHKEH